MELAGGRQRVLTLSEQLAVPDSTDLRDVLKDHNSRRRRGRGEALTLATAIATDMRAATAAATSAGGGRTLLDVLGDEEDGDYDDGRDCDWPHGAGAAWMASSARPDAVAVSAEMPPPEPGTTTLEIILTLDRAAPAAGESTDGGGSAEVAADERPARLSLMALLEKTEWNGHGGGGDPAVVEEGEEAHVCRCCVCMVRQKGAAFIPCGHTFCRVCSRELWERRGSCPLCNAAILDVLDIY